MLISARSVSKQNYLQFQWRYQSILILSVGFLLIYVAILYPNFFFEYFKWGEINAVATPIRLLGIGESERWLTLGIQFLVIISLTTALFLYFSFRKHKLTLSKSFLVPHLGVITLFSLTNSFCEEIIFRLGVILIFQEILPPLTLCMVSGLFFGIPHYFGTPGRIPGVLMATFLGFFLCLSILNTQGIFWAWCIHFVQDFFIIGTLILKDQNKILQNPTPN